MSAILQKEIASNFGRKHRTFFLWRAHNFFLLVNKISLLKEILLQEMIGVPFLLFNCLSFEKFWIISFKGLKFSQVGKCVVSALSFKVLIFIEFILVLDRFSATFVWLCCPYELCQSFKFSVRSHIHCLVSAVWRENVKEILNSSGFT